ncbi:transcription elongation factor SPT [Salix suchowensis]|nr:transcription elongation factor SPT [Salix suchowensis]
MSSGLRACFRCRLVKTYDQFRESGCDNCSFFKMGEDHERVVDCTTPNFTGQARHPLLFSFSYNLNNTSLF